MITPAKFSLSSSVALLAVATVFAAPAQAALSSRDRAALQKAHAEATAPAHMNPGAVDWAKFVDMHYAPTAKLLPPNAPVAEGRDAIVAFFKSLPPLSVFKTEDVEVDGDGSVAYIRGTYVVTMNAMAGKEPTTEKGKYIEIWRKRSDGTWRCVLDIFNADAAPMS